MQGAFRNYGDDNTIKRGSNCDTTGSEENYLRARMQKTQRKRKRKKDFNAEMYATWTFVLRFLLKYRFTSIHKNASNILDDGNFRGSSFCLRRGRRVHRNRRIPPRSQESESVPPSRPRFTTRRARSSGRRVQFPVDRHRKTNSESLSSPVAARRASLAVVFPAAGPAGARARARA